MRLSKFETLFILLVLLFAAPMIVLIPPGAGYDEEDHLVRVWEMSSQSFIPGDLSPQEMQYPMVFRNFAYRQQDSSGTIDSEFWQKYRHTSLDEFGFVHREINTKSIYSPVLLLPQAAVMWLFGRVLDLPVLPVFYLCRLASLFSYLLLVWLSIRLIPFGKWLILALAIIPTALFQAAAVHPDAISNGIGFLFIAGCLKIAESRLIDWKDAAKITGLIFLLFLAKVNLVPLVLLPFFLIPPSRFSNKKIYFFLILSGLILFGIEVIGWNAIATSRMGPVISNDANVKEQLLFILQNPFQFALTVIKDLVTNGFLYIQSWINGYGYYYWTPPTIVSLSFLLSLGAALWVDSTRERLDTRARIAMVLVFLAAYLATVGSLYLTFSPVGGNTIIGVQGRYFVPLALLLFLALPPLQIKKPVISPRWITILLTTALAINVLGIFLAFHVTCGSTYYQTGLCYQPLSKDFADTKVSPPMADGLSLTQEFNVACDGLTEVRVIVKPSIQEESIATTRFIILDSENDQTLYETSIANDTITTEDWYPLRFEPDWHSAGKKYELHIVGQGTASDQGIQFTYTTQPEYDQGNLYENEQLMQEDMILQHGCSTGLRKLLLTIKP